MLALVALLAHGGTGGLVVELSLLSLPLLGVALLWWWGRRNPEPPADEPSAPDKPDEPDDPGKEVEP